jgi:phosphohistidine phosphatase SixA
MAAMHTLRKFRIGLVAKLACLAMLPAAALAQSVPDPDAAQMPPPAPRSSAAVSNLAPAQIIAELMRGGHIIYFRHTSTDFAQNDAHSKSFNDCANQRNLTEAGRVQARTIGAAIRKLKLPIDKIVASPMCRTMETARLALGEPQPDPAMRGAPLPVADSARYAVLKKIFSTPYPRGANLAIASHGNPFYGVAGPPYLAEGEAAVIRGLGNDDFEIVARIHMDDWPALINAQ